jgi:Pentapeptide repeats (9 copies)
MSDENLDNVEQAARIAKIQLETKILQKEYASSHISGSLKDLAPLAGILTALVGIIGLWISSTHWLEDNAQGRFQKALDQFSDKSPYARLAGVTGIYPFLSDKSNASRRLQAMLVMANAIALEDSPTVRRAIVSAFEGVDGRVLGKSELDETSDLLVRVSRGLMSEGDLWQLSSESNTGPEARAKATADALVALLRKGAKPTDMSGIYLADSDLSELDLSNCKFDESILTRSKFVEATLTDTSFANTDLAETDFTSADLQNAKIAVRVFETKHGLYHDYIRRQLISRKLRDLGERENANPHRKDALNVLRRQAQKRS